MKKKIKLKFMENKELKFNFDDENSFKVIFICFLYKLSAYIIYFL